MQEMNARSAASSNTHVGTAPPGYNQNFMTHTLHFHDFATLSTERGEFVKSPEFMLLGNQWSVEMYPGGDEEEMYPGGDEEGSLYLQNMSNNAIVNMDSVSKMAVENKWYINPLHIIHLILRTALGSAFGTSTLQSAWYY